jgi:hypothetical protein
LGTKAGAGGLSRALGIGIVTVSDMCGLLKRG